MGQKIACFENYYVLQKKFKKFLFFIMFVKHQPFKHGVKIL